ncbi:MAG TPA: HAMP domain-containing sensor histidine kinase [Polyangiaceae bacterium]|nr:HAMP domain-containing sensor histidine kinase [Polyangiaceae bacterium]
MPLYVALGGIAGVAYAMFDAFAEARLRSGSLTGPLAQIHTLLDALTPVVAGVLLGVCAHYLALRARLSNVETAAALDRARLHKVERDQAVWVLAAAVLHELNNPLHAMGLLVDELAQSEDDDPRRAGLLGRVRAQLDRARGHLQTLREMRTGGEPEVEGISIDRVVDAVVDDVRAAAAKDGLFVDARMAPPVRARADPTYLRVILENLVDNALASLREGGGRGVTISVSMERSRAVVRVCDDGPPIDARIDAALFEPLRSTKTHGLGLGLPIARALARSMRGDLSLEASASKTFRLELPLHDGA